MPHPLMDQTELSRFSIIKQSGIFILLRRVISAKYLHPVETEPTILLLSHTTLDWDWDRYRERN